MAPSKVIVGELHHVLGPGLRHGAIIKPGNFPESIYKMNEPLIFMKQRGKNLITRIVKPFESGAKPTVYIREVV